MSLARAFENQTLTQAEIEACRPVPGEGGRVLRAYCPFHQSDRQRSLRITVESGRFACFACGAWGYTQAHRQSRQPVRGAFRAQQTPMRSSPQKAQIAAPSNIHKRLGQYQLALPGSIAERYLAWRGIPLQVATQLGLGFAECGAWMHVDPTSGHPVRQWKHGRLVFPHTDGNGELVNLYGRAIGGDSIPKAIRHDHLPGRKGYFNARAIAQGSGPLYVCEGPFDAASLIAAGIVRVVAIFGVAGWRWEWARAVNELVFVFDADQAGERWRTLAREAVLRGKGASFVPPDAFSGCKDVNEAWSRGVLRRWW